MCKITETKAWKNVRRAFNKTERAAILRNLRKVPSLHDGGAFHATSFGDWFIWSASPQGHLYWKRWEMRYCEWLNAQPADDEDFVLPIY